ncbi:glutamate synthase large subunit [Candidatus Omnitrophota bacterium]
MSHNPKMKKQGLYDPQFEHDACGVGFVCNIDGKKTNKIIKQGIQVLEHLKHRGATGSDPKTGDGAGILIQIPHDFLSQQCKKINIELPEAGHYGTGLIFLPQKKAERELCEQAFEHVVKQEGAVFLGWRPVPVDDSFIGFIAKRSQPVMKHAFIGFKKQPTSGKKTKQTFLSTLDIERKLYVIRRQIEHAAKNLKLAHESFFYITNLSSKTLTYKGLFMPGQVKDYFRDLQNESMTSALAIVHSRYSTNTFPSWDLAQPFRYLAHNGEINTLRGNSNWIHARESQFKSTLFGKDIKKLHPVIVPGGSDSSSLDNVLELLYLSGRSLQHAMTMLIPDAWNELNPINDKLRAFYEYHATFMEPWDGPSAIAYTDGDSIGSMLDRNGLRPARYIITKDNFCVMASEVGVLGIAPERVLERGRLRPGKILVIDTKQKKVLYDHEIKSELSQQHPYRKWLNKHKVTLKDIMRSQKTTAASLSKKTSYDLSVLQKNFGYTREELKVILQPMAVTGTEPTGSMGNDAPLAIFSDKAPLLFNYFKQLFAQVTNPAIDSYREALIMSLVSFSGRQKNLLEPTEEHCHMLRLDHPIMTNKELMALKNLSPSRKDTTEKLKGLKSATIDILFDVKKTGDIEKALMCINKQAEALIAKGISFIILSDRNVSSAKAAIPSLLATASIHHHLVRKELRAQAALIIETGEAREVMHCALLIGYGASAINPYLAFETLKNMHASAMFEKKIQYQTIEDNYIHAINKGLLKICSRIGISTIRSYRGAQIFEAVGLNSNVVDTYFVGTVSRIGGATLSTLEKETLERHHIAFKNTSSNNLLSVGGNYQSIRQGERHSWSPEAITTIQMATRLGNQKTYKRFSDIINKHDEHLFYLRGLLQFKQRTSIPLSEVEPASELVKRFCTGAMSFGSISKEAHETLAIAMNRLGGKSNSGEGGEDPIRFIPLQNADSKCSAIKQVASGRFGVTASYLINADEIQIKIAQGAKPGEGGQLPGHKVNQIIAKTRHATPGVTLISPPPHHDIYSIEDLAQLIFDLKNTNPQARISVKLVSEVGVGTVAAGVAKGHADMILIAGHDGGTGASPLSSIKHAGIPWELGLAETQQTLVANDLRGRVRLQTDGQLRTGRDVAIAALLGAEEFGFATAPLIVLGCVMMRKCHLNTCPVGVATQDPLLRKKFTGRPEYVVNYFTFVAEELREIMASLGFRKLDDMVGRIDCLNANKAIKFWKAKDIDLSNILYKQKIPESIATHCVQPQDHGIDTVLDRELIKMTLPGWKTKEPIHLSLPIANTNRTTGAMLSGKICDQWGEDGLPEDTIKIHFTGTAGQSFGAFLAKGITFELEGDANDYVGKGLSGGKIILYPSRSSTFAPEENIIAGNVLFYGATGGEAYINGVCGERFCIRNSGVYAVVEGLGDHGCEYMTGGVVIVLGPVGRNFAAGMSGGIAFVYDETGDFDYFCNKEMVFLERPTDQDHNLIHQMLFDHITYTKSPKAQMILNNFGKSVKKFIKVFPKEYKRVLQAQAQTTITLE